MERRALIESRLDPLIDGTGGGYGNYLGLTVAQIADRFRTLAEEGHNRSARAVLRIAREQIAARGTLGAQRYLAAIGLLATLVMTFVRSISTPENWGKLNLYLGASAVATILFAVGAASIERTVRRNAAQTREVRRLALLALERIVEAEDFSAKPLDREHVQSLREMRKADPERWERVRSALGQ